ncbi:MAG: RelA/SpoT family protein [Pseudomonadales bacterium]|nr:RelA/SpoT family protein [Pseudomonadales bacterium]
MKEDPPYESYFQSQLAKAASHDRVAAPATIERLTESISDYLTPDQTACVVKAYSYAEAAHKGQSRRTGHAYITHPLAVAQILADMRLDHETLMAALLHDVLEDTSILKNTLGQMFTPAVAEIVDGVSKLKTIFRSRAEAQAENFQKMAIAMSKDLRVILVKLADRLHNMRTLGIMSKEKRARIARETLDFYAPIANRFGMHKLKVEYEDLAFECLYPLRADRIRRAVNKTAGNRKELMEETRKSLVNALENAGIHAIVTAREKHLYSIYMKMKNRKKSFSEIMDVFGLRVVVESVDMCYRALGVSHTLYKPLAGRFKDYIAIPKVNGYQSLHTTLFGMHGVPIEVQIRTEQMEGIADNGLAGHWLYKSDDESFDGNQMRARQWIADLLEIQRHAGNSLEFIENLKIDLFPDEVYVFSPKGEIYELSKGACPIDFAYAVHTAVGNTCVSCRIDRRLEPLSVQLRSGQTVEIITSNSATPSPDWLSFAVSGKARAGIRQTLKTQQTTQSIALGRRLLNRSLANSNSSINRLDFRRLRKVFVKFGVRKLDQLLEEIGTGNLMAYVVAQHLLSADNPDYQSVIVDKGGPVAIRGGEGLVVSYSRCCFPVHGDPIVGHMSPGKGFVIHIETCNNAAEIRRRTPNEIIPSRWTSRSEGDYLAALKLDVDRVQGIIAELASKLNTADAGIENIKVDERDAELSSVTIELLVRNRTHLARVMRKLRNIPQVHQLTRYIT